MPKAIKVADPCRELAGKLNCALEQDVGALAGVQGSTLLAWRKRGEGPPYILFGNTPLYPIPELAEFLVSKTRRGAQAAVTGKSVL